MLPSGGVRPPWLRAIIETTPVESHRLSPDGLPAGPFTMLVEAMSWLALGRCIPHKTWHLQALLPAALEDHLKARAEVAQAMRGTPRERRRTELTTLKGKEESNYGRTRSELAKAIAADVEIRAAYASIGTGSQGEDAILERAQRSLFDKLATGVLTCEGRDGPRAPLWSPLPPSYFSHPVMLRLNHNILELRDDTPADAVDLVRSQISRWIGLRVRTDDLRAAFSETTLWKLPAPTDPASSLQPAPLPDLKLDVRADAWLRHEMVRRAKTGEKRNWPTMTVALTTKFPDLKDRDARNLIRALPVELRPKRGPQKGSR
jgi:hypothetical protein